MQPKSKRIKDTKNVKRTNLDEEITRSEEEEGTSGRDSKTNSAAKPEKTRKKAVQVDDDEEYSTDVPVAAKAPSKKTKKAVKVPK